MFPQCLSVASEAPLRTRKCCRDLIASHGKKDYDGKITAFLSCSSSCWPVQPGWEDTLETGGEARQQDIEDKDRRGEEDDRVATTTGRQRSVQVSEAQPSPTALMYNGNTKKFNICNFSCCSLLNFTRGRSSNSLCWAWKIMLDLFLGERDGMGWGSNQIITIDFRF